MGPEKSLGFLWMLWVAGGYRMQGPLPMPCTRLSWNLEGEAESSLLLVIQGASHFASRDLGLSPDLQAPVT